MRTNIRDTCHLKKALHSTILAILSVKHREDHIDHFPGSTILFKHKKALTADRRKRATAVIRMGLPLATGQHGVICAAKTDPIAILGDTNRDHIILFLIHIQQHRLCRPQRYIMLRTDTAKQY